MSSRPISEERVVSRPEFGDLFIFPETAGFPIEWAVLDRRRDRLLVVPADTIPFTGSADVEIPLGEPAGPLHLRCRFALWLDAARFDSSRHTGALAPDAVARARGKCSELETGTLSAPPLAYETDADPEYKDWVREVFVPAQAALAKPLTGEEEPAPAPVLPLRRWTSLGNPYALAASILLMVTLGLAGGLIWQNGQISDLVTGKERIEDDLRKERERFTGDLRQAAEAHRREIEERDRQAIQREQEDRQRIADLEKRLDSASRTRPLVNAPFALLAPRDPTRGDPDAILLPPGASYLFLILTVTDLRSFPEYRLEIRRKDTANPIWTTSGLHKTGIAEVSVALPLDLLPPGDYRLRLDGLREGKAEPVGEYEIRIGENE